GAGVARCAALVEVYIDHPVDVECALPDAGIIRVESCRVAARAVRDLWVRRRRRRAMTAGARQRLRFGPAGGAARIALAGRVAPTIGATSPRAVVSWGPRGSYRHPRKE